MQRSFLTKLLFGCALVGSPLLVSAADPINKTKEVIIDPVTGQKTVTVTKEKINNKGEEVIVTKVKTIPLSAPATSGPAGDPQSANAPLDGGLSLLIAAGVGFGAKKAYDKRKAESNEAI